MLEKNRLAAIYMCGKTSIPAVGKEEPEKRHLRIHTGEKLPIPWKTITGSIAALVAGHWGTSIVAWRNCLCFIFRVSCFSLCLTKYSIKQSFCYGKHFFTEISPPASSTMIVWCFFAKFCGKIIIPSPRSVLPHLWQQAVAKKACCAKACLAIAQVTRWAGRVLVVFSEHHGGNFFTSELDWSRESRTRAEEICWSKEVKTNFWLIAEVLSKRLGFFVG